MLMNNWSILISYELIFLQLLIPLKSNLHFSFFFSIEKGVFPSIQNTNTHIRSPRLFASKRRVCFSEKSDYTGKAAIFFDVHASCTVSMCNVKLPKGTNYTTKIITIEIKSYRDDGRMLFSSSLFLGSIKNDCFN